MTLQTTSPLTHQSLNATNRGAREVANLVADGQMTLDAPYQRGSVWTIEQRRNLVRSWMLGLPIPAVVVNRRFDVPGWDVSDGVLYAVIDGKQRIEAAASWFRGELTVPASWFRPEHIESTVATDDGEYVSYDTLTVPGKRYTGNRFMLPVAEARVPTVADEALIFGLVNGAGVPQDDETLARAAQIAGK